MTAEVVRIYSPKYFGLPAERHGEYVIGVEKLPNMQDDITKLFEQHWEETETKYLDEPLRPDWDMLHFMSEQNRLLIFTARTAEGEMVGDIMYLTPRCVWYLIA